MSKVGCNLATNAVHFHLAEYYEAPIELLCIQHGNVTTDDSFTLKALHSLVNGRTAKVYSG